MSLTEEIQQARKKVVTDGYEMSLGEIISLYKNKELVIDPVFQRLFRWDDERKTRFIESIILGIPVPPIFVYQDENGVWELVDGLQRLSTVLQLTGDLRVEPPKVLESLVLNGTRFLPSLNNKRWRDSESTADDGLGQALQIEIKRARIRVEILKSESDVSAKYELFQRLNTGGAKLTEQEVRNSIAVSLNKEFYEWLVARSEDRDFIVTTAQTKAALESQMGIELVLRFLAFRHIEYVPGLDVHEYLDDALFRLASDPKLDLRREEEIFERTFSYLEEALEEYAFKKWNGTEFTGKFLMSLFEVIAVGVAQNLPALTKLTADRRRTVIMKNAQKLWANKIFLANSGAGVRGTTRLSRLLPLAAKAMKP
ncbi:MAG: DUF262 domain-containing protein [Comamonadaceae bacterium]|nr:MAG: DUF262 domain-containing protein [Comamonadaceae bacterium]